MKPMNIPINIEKERRIMIEIITTALNSKDPSSLKPNTRKEAIELLECLKSGD